jgi:hypothetical protein
MNPSWKGCIIDYHTGIPQVRVSLWWSIRVRFCLFSLLRHRRQDSNPIVRVHLRHGEQVSGTIIFAILHWEKANKVFGMCSLRDCSQMTTSSTSWSLFERRHCIHHPALTSYNYIDWGSPMIGMANPEDNGASVAPDNRPAIGYTLILLWFYLFIMINLPCLSSVRIIPTLNHLRLLDCVEVQKSVRHIQDHIQAIQVLNCSSIDLHMRRVCA